MSAFTVEQVQKFEALLKVLEADWAKVKPVLTGWESALTLNSPALDAGFKFVFSGIDQFVQLAAQFTVAGADKKALVVQYANDLFNLMLQSLVPVVWKPVVMSAQTFFDSILDAVIEFAYDKLTVVVPVPTPVTPAK